MTVTRWQPSFGNRHSRTMEDMIGNTIERLLADAGYRGHNAPYKFRITSGQKRHLHRRSSVSCDPINRILKGVLIS